MTSRLREPLYNKHTNKFISEDEISKINSTSEIYTYEMDIKTTHNEIQCVFKKFPNIIDFNQCNNFTEQLEHIKQLFNKRTEEIHKKRMKTIKIVEVERKEYINSYEPYIIYNKNTKELEDKKRRNQHKYFDYDDNKCIKKIKKINAKLDKEIETFQTTCVHKHITSSYADGYTLYKDCLVCNKQIFIRDRHP
jgi:hypothetical protein